MKPRVVATQSCDWLKVFHSNKKSEDLSPRFMIYSQLLDVELVILYYLGDLEDGGFSEVWAEDLEADWQLGAGVRI